jgi:hypothetical protein
MIAEQTFLNENGFIVYREYNALKRHFTSTYDYFKYNGKINVSYESFISRRDAYSFQKLSKNRDYKNLMLSNIVENPKIWIGALFEESANDVYFKWKKRNDSITTHVKDELDKLNENFKSNFIVTNGNYPYITDLYLQKQISIETLSILTKLTNSQEYWSKSVVDKIIFPDIMNKIDNYYPFIIYSKEKVKKVIKDHFF